MVGFDYFRASGYLTILVPPAVLVTGMMHDMPILGFGVLILVLPLLRAIFGDTADRQPEWSERVAVLLEWLPMTAAGAYVAALGYLVRSLHGRSWTAAGLACVGLSLWATTLFATCVAHELLHRRARGARFVGRVLSGMIGYPLQEHEHRAHHCQSGCVELAECPATDESLWSFTARRARRVVLAAWEGDMLAADKTGHRLSGGLFLAVLSMLATAAAFSWAAGLGGLLLYIATAAALAWALQAITYVQHWGLGSECDAARPSGGFAWEDRCRLQAWLTLGISFHQAHHQNSSVPYYRRNPSPGAPLQPAGYVILLFASMVPPLWRSLMGPALDHWRRSPLDQKSAGRMLFCLKRNA